MKRWSLRGPVVLTLLAAAYVCSECRRDYTAHNGEVAGSNPAGSTTWTRSSEVERLVSALFVAALAAEAQTAGRLTGTEEMEGASPSGGSLCGDSSTAEREDASLEIRVRFPVAALTGRNVGVLPAR